MWKPRLIIDNRLFESHLTFTLKPVPLLRQHDYVSLEIHMYMVFKVFLVFLGTSCTLLLCQQSGVQCIEVNIQDTISGLAVSWGGSPRGGFNWCKYHSFFNLIVTSWLSYGISLFAYCYIFAHLMSYYYTEALLSKISIVEQHLIKNCYIVKQHLTMYSCIAEQYWSDPACCGGIWFVPPVPGACSGDQHKVGLLEKKIGVIWQSNVGRWVTLCLLLVMKHLVLCSDLKCIFLVFFPQVFWSEEHEGGHELPPGGPHSLLSGRLQGCLTEREGGLRHIQTNCKQQEGKTSLTVENKYYCRAKKEYCWHV